MPTDSPPARPGLLDIFTGRMPDITPAQIAAFLFAGVPHLLVLLGVSLGVDQQEALDGLLLLAVALVGGDLGLRGARNIAQSRVDAAMTNIPGDAELDSGRELADPEAEDVPLEDLPSDEEEFAAPPPLHVAGPYGPEEQAQKASGADAPDRPPFPYAEDPPQDAGDYPTRPLHDGPGTR